MVFLNSFEKVIIVLLVICGSGALTWACLKGDQEAIREETHHLAHAQEREQQLGLTLQSVPTTDTNTHTENLSLVQDQTGRGKVKKESNKRHLQPFVRQGAIRRHRKKKDALRLLHNLEQVDLQTGLRVQGADTASLDDVAPVATEAHQVDSLTSSFLESHPVPASEIRNFDDVARDFIMGLPEVVEGKKADDFVDFLKTISTQRKSIAPARPSSVDSPNMAEPSTTPFL